MSYPTYGLTLSQLQEEVNAWADHNFPNRRSYYCLLGAMEELGELSHAHLKAAQGIRGTKEEHEAAEKDAIGDIIIYLAHYCSDSGYDLEESVTETWKIVSKRDWIKYPKNGVSE